MGKKYKASIKNKKDIPQETKPKPKPIKEKFSVNGLNNTYLWILTALLAIIYFVFSTFSDGL